MSGAKDSETRKRAEDALAQAKKVVEGPLSIEYEEVYFKNDYDFEERVNVFSEIFEKEEELVVNITGGTKFDSLILYLVALKYPKKVKDIVYIREDITDFMSFPKFVYSGSLTDFELELLKVLKSRPMTIQDLATKLDKQLPQISRYVTGLEERGLIISEKESKERTVRLAYKMLI